MEDKVYQELIELRQKTEERLWRLENQIHDTRRKDEVRNYVLIGILIILFWGLCKLPDINFSPRYMLSANGLVMIETQSGYVWPVQQLLDEREARREK